MAKSTVAAHLREVHEALAEHHVRMAKLAKDRGHKDTQSEHENMAAFHQEMAEKCAGGMDKAMAGHDPNAIVPDRIGAIPTTFAMPRAGSPNLGSNGRPNVPVEFEKFVSVEDDL